MMIIECGLTWASTRPSRAGVVRQEPALSEARHLEPDRGNEARRSSQSGGSRQGPLARHLPNLDNMTNGPDSDTLSTHNDHKHVMMS